MTFDWKAGFFPYRSSVSAQAMGERISALLQELGMFPEGVLTLVPKERLLEDAKPAESPIHDAFEWDDAVAGHMTRLGQAGDYLRNTIEVEIVPGTSLTRQRKLMIHVTQAAPTPDNPKATTSGYAKFDDAIADHDTLERLVEQWLRDLRALLARGSALPPLRVLCAAIKSLLTLPALPSSPWLTASARRGRSPSTARGV
jgi:hypothetical protein